MVKPVSKFWLLIMLLLPVLTAAQQPAKSVIRMLVDKSHVEMGKYILLHLQYQGETIPQLSNPAVWYDDFFVDRRSEDAEKLSDGLIKYTETIRLYPRHTGEIILHAIALGGAVSRPLTLHVSPAVRHNIDGTPHWLPVVQDIWQGQTIIVTIEQRLFNSSNQLLPEDGVFPGFAVQPLVPVKRQEKDVTIVTLSWQLTAQTPGILQLEAPAIEQRGRGRWRFYLPRISIRVKPLPAYIPPAVPVGQLQMNTALIWIKDIPVWQVDFTNRGQLPDEIYSIRQQLASAAELTPDDVQQHIIHPEDKQNISQRYSIAAPQWIWGLGDGKTIHIDYFDVTAGQIKTVQGFLPAFWNVPQSWRYLLYGILLIILSGLIFVVLKFLQWLLAWQHYRQAIQQMYNAHQLRRLLLTQGRFATLEKWQSTRTQYVSAELVRQLNSLCFAQQQSLELAAIKKNMVKLHSFIYWLHYVKPFI